MNIDQLLNTTQQIDPSSSNSRIPAPTSSGGDARRFRETLGRVSGQGGDQRSQSSDAADSRASRQPKQESVSSGRSSSSTTENVAPQDEAVAADGTIEEGEEPKITKAQLDWLLAQLANLTHPNQPALSIDAADALTGPQVHSSAVADLSRAVGARALVASTVATIGTPTPQATNEIAATNLQAQDLSPLVTLTGFQLLASEAVPTAPTEQISTNVLSAKPTLPQQEQSTALDLVLEQVPAAPMQKGPVMTSNPGGPPPSELPANEIAAQLASDVPTAASTEMVAAESQNGSGVLVRPQAKPAPRQTKIETDQAFDEQSAAESGRAGLQSTILAVGEQEGKQFESENQEAASANRIAGQREANSTRHDVRTSDSQVPPFTIAGQDLAAPNHAEPKVTPTPAVLPLEADFPTKPTGTPTIRLEVSPPDMGRVQVRVSVTDQSVYASVVTDHASVRDLLLRQQDRLQDALGAYGLGMGSFNVEVGQQGQQRSEWGEQPDPRTLARLAAEVPKPAVEAVAARGWDDQGLNLFA